MNTNHDDQLAPLDFSPRIRCEQHHKLLGLLNIRCVREARTIITFHHTRPTTTGTCSGHSHVFCTNHAEELTGEIVGSWPYHANHVSCGHCHDEIDTPRDLFSTEPI